ncbi:unannotated protein [freshwater metagenome]|uniref:Unannotated protein n=1 Tax=freshwater metagenome TaxID=449393 RepID=A0A6J6Y7F8_9ZZZZ
MIIGQGYVGLPLAMRCVEVGYKVIGYDTDDSKIGALKDGVSPIDDVTNDQVTSALSSTSYIPTSAQDDLKDFDIAVITVPTPLRDDRPDTSFIEIAGSTIAKHLRSGSLVVLESTSYPGTTEEILRPILEKGSGLTCGLDFSLGFSPERIDPGNKSWTLRTTPKLISGVDEKSIKKVQEFYKQIVDNVVVSAGIREAEFAKLLENTYRQVNIALVNELAVHAHALKIDIWEVIRIAATKPFGYAPFYPGPGVGGHCLPIDPEYLSWKFAQNSGQNSDFIKLATTVNKRMPSYVVQRLVRALSDRGKNIKNSKVLVIGLSYKKNSSDVRESPALDVIKNLVNHGADVIAYDPFVRVVNQSGFTFSHRLEASDLKKSDAVLILTNHDGVDYEEVVRSAKYIFDIRHCVVGHNVEYL